MNSRLILTALLASLLLSVVPCKGFSPAPKTAGRNRTDSRINKAINQDYRIHARHTKGEIKLDGTANEPDWNSAETASNFYMVLPYDTGHCKARSEIKVVYDDKALYLAVIFHDTLPGKRPVESLRRDFVFNNNDNFLVFIDPFSDQTTGYTFGVNAAGALWDGTLSNGYATNLNWDSKWDVKTRNYPDKWVAEMRIPFKSIRYRNDVSHWNIQFSRLDLKLNEKSAWAPVPRQFPTASLAYTGQLILEDPPPKSGLNLSLIPYVFGGISRNFEKSEPVVYKRNFGMDAKLGLSTSLNLDLTYNPDFSQAEVDDQVVNLDRFELYFPEKRQFFLENSDLFGNFGATAIRPFFSRRIGLDAPVDAGARLSGRLGNDWRIGMMDMQTGTSGVLLARNFFVASLQKKVFSRSNIGAIFVNKEHLNIPSSWTGNQYNRIAGLEYNLASLNNFWNAKLFLQKSFTPGMVASEEFSEGLNLVYSRKTFLFDFTQLYSGKDFNAETGYVPRVNFLRFDPKATIKFYPDKGTIENHGITAEFDNYAVPGTLNLTDRNLSLNYFVNFRNRARIEFKTGYWFVLLRKDFDPTNMGVNFLQTGNSYTWKDMTFLFNSDNRKQLKYDLQAGYGGYFNGRRAFVQGSILYKQQPHGYISLIYSYNHLYLPQPWQDKGFWLIGPKLDITFTEKLFFTTYVQYNNQANNMNINARFQWRYKPVSDIFLVYSDNYFPETWNARNRAVVLKMTYWFN